ncbi:MAG: peptidoglycan-binding protein [Calditrichaeota bacterium]|nr:peptidoglycan-binding protein [Calditrichota bacterium]
MKSLNDVVRSVLIGLTGIGTITEDVLSNNTNDYVKDLPDSEPPIFDTKKKNFTKKPVLILKQYSNSNDFFFASHRSHRSHSSHRSHYSSRTTTPSYTPKTPKTYTKQNDELGSRTLKQGHKGKDVAKLESKLKTLLYSIIPDQIYDKNTTNIVKDIQSRFGLSIDGVVGPLTLYYIINFNSENYKFKKGLTKANLGSRILKLGFSGKDVRLLKQKMNKLGYKLEISDDFDIDLEKAIKSFQKKNGINPDGIVSFLTFLKLGILY